MAYPDKPCIHCDYNWDYCMIYKTTPLTREQRQDLEAKAAGQEKDIARFYALRPNEYLSPSTVWNAFGQRWPITSIRRAITNLTGDGHLIKTSKTVQGEFGRNEYCWKWHKWPEQTGQSELFGMRPLTQDYETGKF